MPFAATWMDTEIIILTEIIQNEKGTCYISLICNLKNDTSELINKTETESQILKTNLRLPKGKRKGRG